MKILFVFLCLVGASLMEIVLIFPNQDSLNHHLDMNNVEYLAEDRNDRQIDPTQRDKQEKASTQHILGAFSKVKCKRRFYWSSIRKKCVPRYYRPRRP